MRSTTVVLLATVLLLSGAPAEARRVTVFDGNDTRGRLDIGKAYKFGDTRPLWRVRTWHRWSAARVFDRGYVLVFLDTFGNKRYDYYAIVSSDGVRMRGRLVRDFIRKRDRRVGYLHVWRREPRSVFVYIPLGKMIVGDRRDHYLWYVQTLLTGPSCPRVCFDRAPNSGGIEEPLAPPAGAAGG